jgi:hypothetical protein
MSLAFLLIFMFLTWRITCLLDWYHYPFIKIAWTKIDVHDGTLKVEFDDKVISFNIFEAMMYPSDLHYYFLVDILDSLT